MWIPDLAGRAGPKYLRLLEAMAEDVAKGRLAAGARLPPHRELAWRLGVSANTTSRAYAEGVKRGLLRGEVGRGTFVRAAGPEAEEAPPESLRRARDGPVDLSRNLPMPGLSAPHVRRALAEIAADPRLDALLDYQTDADLARHREAGRAWLAFGGVEAPVERIVPTVGGQHGLLCALTALLQPGDLLLVEALTYPPVLAMAARLGLRTGAVAMDAEGAVPESFEDWCHAARPRAFYLTPTLQAPTTATQSMARRVRIAEIAARHGVILIEDAVFAPLAGDPPPPLAALAPECAVHVASLSKTVAPGLRVGWLAAPGPRVAALHHAVNLSVWMTPPTTLELARRLIDDGAAETLTLQHRRLAERRQRLARGVLGIETAAPAPSGFHLWMDLPEGWRADAFRAECARRGVIVSEARSFAADP
ncbi:MAG: PLP-dependent aminotransferase family protein, partial [Pseudomonadota bacterium]